MWVAGVLRRSDEYIDEAPASCKALNSKKLLRYHSENRWREPCYWLPLTGNGSGAVGGAAKRQEPQFRLLFFKASYACLALASPALIRPMSAASSARSEL